MHLMNCGSPANLSKTYCHCAVSLLFCGITFENLRQTPMHKFLLITLLAGILTACSDSGVVVNDGGTTSGGATSGSTGLSTGSTTGNTSGNATGLTGGTTGVTTGNTTGLTGGTTGLTGSTAGSTSGLTTGDTGGNLNPDEVAAARFLNQATFGATEQTIAEFISFGSVDAWLNNQFSLPVTTQIAYTRANSNGSSGEARHEAWWNNALNEPDQLRQRVAFALSQIFVVSDLDQALSNAQYGMSDYYDMLSRNAFGNFRTLLEDVTLHPVMGVYLSMVLNEKANEAENIRPDENFAREVLQLFSIGLFELNLRGEPIPIGNPTPSYTQSTIEEFARVFTGWNYPAARFWADTNRTSDFFIGRMVANEQFHDKGSKTLLNGAVTTAGWSASQDMSAALDNIFNHPNVGPFITKQLIQRLVTSNPSPAYVERVATIFNNNGNGVRGDLQAVVRAILVDDEARTGHLNNAEFGKIREPIIRLTHLWRALEGTPGPSSGGVHNTANFTLNRVDEMFGQAIMQSNSVFNFYLPDNPLATGSGLLSPEMQIMTEANLANTHNNYHHQIYRFNNRSDLSDDNPRVTTINLEALTGMATDPNALLDWYNLILFAGSMPNDVRTLLFDYMNTLGSSDSDRFARVQDSLFMILVSPAFHLQR